MSFRFSPFPILKTERLLLRQPTYEDKEVVLFLRSDPTVNQYISRPSPQYVEDAVAFIDKINKGTSQGKNSYWSITLKENTTMIGSICLWNFSEDGRVGEVGYDLHPDFQGKGIMSEALQCVLLFGFDNLGLECIEAFTHRENEASKNLLRKNGFHLIEGRKDADNENNLIFEVFNERKK